MMRRAVEDGAFRGIGRRAYAPGGELEIMFLVVGVHAVRRDETEQYHEEHNDSRRTIMKPTSNEPLKSSRIVGKDAHKSVF